MPSADPHHDRRWKILVFLGLAQLMVVLDATIVNIALPSAQTDLGFSDDSRQWVITAYALAFGSLLLIGGRISDHFGRRPTFIAGTVGFALASAVGGAANGLAVLVVARAAQGAFGALLAPAALALLTTIFTDARERATAFGVYGAIAGVGGGLGLLLGGVLTQWLSWRWCLYVNLAFAIPAAAGALALLHHARGERDRPPMDVPGAVAATGGVFALVYGFSNAETHSWGAPLTVGMFVASVVLLVAFVVRQRAAANPLLPLRVVLDRDRGGSFLAMGLVAVALFGVFLFMTYYLQRTKGFSPLATGLAFQPMNLAIMAMAALGGSHILPRVGPRIPLTLGMVLGAVAMVLFAQLDAGSAYGGFALFGLIVMGLGLGLVFSTAMSTATLGVGARDSGVAAAMANTSQQVGGSVGTALLSTLFAGAVGSYTASHHGPAARVADAAAMHGYVTIFWVAAAILAVAAVVIGLLVRSGVPQHGHDPHAVPVLAQ